jgi:hypothetical protein
MQDVSTLASTMDILNKRFMKECQKVDVLHPDVTCDTNFIRDYIKAYDLYVIYMKMPEEHRFKFHFLGLLIDALKKIEVT